MPKLTHRELSYELDAHGVGHDDDTTEPEVDIPDTGSVPDTQELYRKTERESADRLARLYRYEDLRNLVANQRQADVSETAAAARELAHESDANPDDIGLLEVAVDSLSRAYRAGHLLWLSSDLQRRLHYDTSVERFLSFDERQKLGLRTAPEHDAVQQVAPELKQRATAAIETLIDNGIVPEHVRDRLDRIQQADVHTVTHLERNSRLGSYAAGIIHINPEKIGITDMEALTKTFIHESFHMLAGMRGRQTRQGNIRRSKSQRAGLMYKVDGQQYTWLNEAVTEYLTRMATDAMDGRNPGATPVWFPDPYDAIYYSERDILRMLSGRAQIDIGEFIEAYFEDSYTGPNRHEEGAYAELFKKLEAKLGPKFLRELSKRSNNGENTFEAARCISEHLPPPDTE